MPSFAANDLSSASPSSSKWPKISSLISQKRFRWRANSAQAAAICARGCPGRGKYFEQHPDLGGQRAHELAQRLHRGGAVRALEVRVLDDGDGRTDVAELRAVVVGDLRRLSLGNPA